jgi:HAD superfamily hydrolase (TIGR01509 family)
VIIKGLIFDFDGLILDTETPDVMAWLKIYKKHGQNFNFGDYALSIGTIYRMTEPALDLQRLVPGLNAEEVFNEWTELERLLIKDQIVLPGVIEYLQTAKTLNIKVAIASSSEKSWVVGHLEQHGIREYFDFIHTVDETGIPKPDPALYQMALKSLRLSPNEVIAFEDSTNGISAAKSAGIFCVSVPNPITKYLDLNNADLILDSLASLPLQELLVRFKLK